MDQLNEFEDTFLELYISADILLMQQKPKSTIILLSKALFALVDYIIFKEYKKVTDNHTDRFRILRTKLPIIHKTVDNVWNRYTDTYTKPAVEETITLLKSAIKEISNHETVSQKIKEAIK
ncbi:TPA: hypothetical protein HA246_01010 [Candidatus Woesearchaeota archaeon]|nr:hypothetical protein [Candidatus Woesearchaeota archaeon]